MTQITEAVMISGPMARKVIIWSPILDPRPNPCRCSTLDLAPEMMPLGSEFPREVTRAVFFGSNGFRGHTSDSGCWVCDVVGWF